MKIENSWNERTPGLSIMFASNFSFPTSNEPRFFSFGRAFAGVAGGGRWMMMAEKGVIRGRENCI